MKHRIKGGIIIIIGYVLSPLSWWNDLFVNIPLAYAFALPFGFISRSLFFPVMVAGYWGTNVIGFMLMHHGAKDLFSKEEKGYARKEVIKDIIISLLYTAIVIILIQIGWLRFPTEYFS